MINFVIKIILQLNVNIIKKKVLFKFRNYYISLENYTVRFFNNSKVKFTLLSDTFVYVLHPETELTVKLEK